MFNDKNGQTASVIKTGFFAIVGIFGCVCAIGGLLTCNLATILTGAGCVAIAFAQGK